MATVQDVLSALERLAPRRHALGFDKIGLQVGSSTSKIARAVVSLDRSLAAVSHAREIGAQLLVSHHPLIFSPLATVDTRSHTGRTVIELIRADIAFVAAHTNWDAAIGGINDELAKRLGLTDVKPFGQAAEVKNLKLVFFSPADAVEPIIDAVSQAGAGVIGAYRRCAFLSDGHGTFIGDETTNPTIGEPGEKEVTNEVRVEMILPVDLERSVTKALKQAHPYEEPAFNYMLMTAVPEQPLGRIGTLPEPTTLQDLARSVDSRLDTRTWAWGVPNKKIKRVAVVGGAGDSDWIDAQRAGADALVTGEVKQHVAVEASESGMTILAAGHYATEQPGCEALRKALEDAVTDVEWNLYTPEPGMAGRPF